MALRFLGKETQSGNSPTLWATDTEYVIQGFALDQATLNEIGKIPAGELVVRVPKQLMTHLAKDSDGANRV
jgi:hypothetical protein